MKVLAAVLAALALAPAAEAKFRIRLTLSDATPAVEQRVRVSLRAEVADPAGIELRLIAQPPGVHRDVALGRESRYRVPLVLSGSVWRGTLRFSRPGRWFLIVPNWGAPGYAIPPPLVRSVLVSPR